MAAEMFSAWLDGVRSLSAEQCRKAFMVIALREADDRSDQIPSEAAGVAGMVERPAAMAATLGDAGQNRTAPAAPSIDTDDKCDALTATARRRVQIRGCPHCDAKDVRPWGRAHGLARYRCADCHRTFNALSGTTLARLRHKDRWSDQARALMTGESVAKAASRCGVAYTTAFRWRHRFRDVHPGIIQGQAGKGRRARAGGPICRVPRAARWQASQDRPVGRAKSRFWSPATGPAQPLMRCCPNSTGCLSPQFCPGWSLRPTNYASTAAKPLPRSRGWAALPIMCCQNPAAPCRVRRSCTSTASMPTTAALRSGCVRSMASQPRTCRTTSAGAEHSRRSVT